MKYFNLLILRDLSNILIYRFLFDFTWFYMMTYNILQIVFDLLNSFMIVASYRITVNHTNSVKFLLDYVLPSSDENVDRALHRDEVSEEEIHAAIGECSAMKFFIRGMQFCS